MIPRDLYRSPDPPEDEDDEPAIDDRDAYDFDDLPWDDPAADYAYDPIGRGE